MRPPDTLASDSIRAPGPWLLLKEMGELDNRDGFSVDASARIGVGDRSGLEQLLRLIFANVRYPYSADVRASLPECPDMTLMWSST